MALCDLFNVDFMVYKFNELFGEPMTRESVEG